MFKLDFELSKIKKNCEQTFLTGMQSQVSFIALEKFFQKRIFAQGF